MLIQVLYDDGSSGMVKPYMLDKLLDEKKVASFLRSDGWAVVGRDLIRCRRNSQGYDGVERRAFDAFNAPFEQGLVVTLLQEITWVVGMLVLVSILLSGLL